MHQPVVSALHCDCVLVHAVAFFLNSTVPASVFELATAAFHMASLVSERTHVGGVSSAIHSQAESAAQAADAMA